MINLYIYIHSGLVFFLAPILFHKMLYDIIPLINSPMELIFTILFYRNFNLIQKFQKFLVHR